MSITSFAFVLFIFSTLILYYIVPKKHSWYVLLVASVTFYLLSNLKGAIFVLLTASSIYGSTIWLQSITDKQKFYFKENKDTITKEQKSAIKSKNNKKRLLILVLTLLLNFGIMCVVKYSHFAVNTINSVFGSSINNEFNLIVPLGLSFYTFQSTGYLINIYWNNYKPEKNFLKVLLFVSFFPQMTQGPISEFQQISSQLFCEHKFEYKNFAYGGQRIIWGFFKKLLIANTMGVYVSNTFSSFNEYTGITTLLGAFCYSIQIYADFSGYMDIMCGFCEMLDIRLSENFDRPYFSKSIAEYWRRWHISLGDWFKQYIYYPIAVSKWNRNLGKNLTDKFGKTVGANLPATIALIVVWITTGLWHGASWSYIAWGAVNGIIIIFSMWMEPIYIKIKKIFHINDSSVLWKTFQIIRTFILVTIIKVLPEVGGIRSGLNLWKHIFTNFEIPTKLSELLSFVPFSNLNLIYFLIAIVGTITMFIVSLIQYRYKVRYLFNKLPFFIRIFLLSFFIMFIIVFGVYNLLSTGKGGFMYAQF